MKTTTITAVSISVCFLTYIKRIEIKRFNEQKEFNLCVAILKHEINDLKQDKARKRDIVMNIENLLPEKSYKDAIRFKKIYFKK